MYDEGRFGAVYEGSLPYCFVSYLHQDSDRILPLLERLQKKNCRLWYDAGIEPGDEWPETIAEHILKAEICLAFLSKRALESPYIKGELHFAAKNKIPVICILFEENIGKLSGFIGAEPVAVFPCGPSAYDKVAGKIGRVLPGSVFEKQNKGSLPIRIAVTAAAAAVLLGSIFFLRNRKSPDKMQPLDPAEEIESIAESAAGLPGLVSSAEEPVSVVSEPREFTGAFADLLSACDGVKRYYDESGEWSVTQSYKDLMEYLESALKKGDSVDFLLRDLNGDGTEELILGVLTDGRFRICEVFFANGEEAERGNTSLYNRTDHYIQTYIMTGVTEDGHLVSTRRRFQWDTEKIGGNNFGRCIYQVNKGYLAQADIVSAWDGKFYRGVQLESLKRHTEQYADCEITEAEFAEFNKQYELPELTVYPVTDHNLSCVREDRFGELSDGTNCQQTDHDDISIYWTE